MSKKSDTYWGRRKAKRMVQAMDKAENVSKKLDEIYTLANRGIQLQLDKLFERYRSDHGLTEQEAKRILQNVHNLGDIQELKRALENTTRSDEIQSLLALINSAPYASRMKRYERLQEQAAQLHGDLFQRERAQTRTFYEDFAKDTYYRSIFDLHQQAGVAFDFGTIDQKELRWIVDKSWLGENYSQRIWGNTQILANELQRELAIALLTGRSSYETAKAIDERFKKGKNSARRLIRTESAHLHNEMEARAYEEADIEKYRFVATLDLRTSSFCRPMDGKVFKVSERKVGKNYPPLHPWCRSTTVAADDEEWISEMKRRAIDPETGRNITVSGDMTYNDWYAKYVKPKYKVDNLDIWKIEHASNQYEKYRSLLGERAPKTLEDYIDLKYNNIKGYEQLKDRAYIQSKFDEGSWLDKINPEKQARHIKSTVGKNKSYFYDDVDVAALYEKYKMTGYLDKDSKGSRTGNEKIDLLDSMNIGVDAFTGKIANALTIKHSKTGVHIIPTYYERERR